MPRRATTLFALLLVACGPSAQPPVAPLEIAKVEPGPAPVAVDAEPPPPPKKWLAEGADESGAVVPIFADDAVKGPRDAWVTIVILGDFQCPFCARANPTMQRVRSEYGDQVRMVWRDSPLPFHPRAKPTAIAARAVLEAGGPEAFWRFHDLAFADQAHLDDESFERWAVEAGVDRAAFEAKLSDPAVAERVARSEEVVKSMGGGGTPRFFVNGVQIVGAQPFDLFKSTIDAELERAKEIHARGTARDKVYAAAADQNRGRTASATSAPSPNAINRVPIAGSPVRGSANALVTIVELADYECRFCAKAEDTLKELRQHYGDKIRIVWKDSLLHGRSRAAAIVAREARAQRGDAGFWAMHDSLLADIQSLGDADLEARAAAQKLDVKAVTAALASNKHAIAIDDDADLAEELGGSSSTPTFFVNGRKMVGAQPVESFKTVIDDELKKAEALVKQGVPPAQIYDRVMLSATNPAEPVRKHVEIDPRDPARGAAQPRVTVQLFTDFECPACSGMGAALDELLKTHGQKVRVVYRNRPISHHVHARLAAELALEAKAQLGVEGYLKAYTLLMQNQQALERSDLDEYGKRLGLDAKKLAAALDGHTHAAEIDADLRAAEAVGVDAVPALLVGDLYVTGAPKPARLRRLVDRSAGEVAIPVKPAALVTQDLASGSGPAAKAGDKLSVHYVGTLHADGKKFDSSRDRSSPFVFELGKGMVIKGWEQGLVGMKAGGRRRLVIPADLGYGDRGSPPSIPPKATLIFDVELLSIQ